MEAALTPFVHEFVSPINRYKALAVRHGFVPSPVYIYEGRQCYVTQTTRTRRKKGWGFFNVCSVHFLDDGSIQMIPAGKFSKAKAAPLPKE